MSKFMLIDAVHREETRVALVNDNQIEDFDYETEFRKQLRGNIYLAVVTRIEPSLQAAFVEYGGNRHGFLAFNEIHPDYYHIPVEDLAALKAEAEAEEARLSAAENVISGDDEDNEDDALDDNERPVRRTSRRYKIQEVVRRRQVMLVQVVKEERGNKGAALTTYLSLAGRYCVLMPNTARGGGISRKITNAVDRKRLKKVTQELEVPKGMGLIVRTAGAKRTKLEIKRDFEYLLRMWDNIRDQTLKSVAPALIHEEGSLIYRAVRDLYDKDVEQILVQGDAAYREAKDHIKMLMPSHAKKVQLHKEDKPLFATFGVEKQLDGVFSPTVQLKSGGYLVIHQTEALVAVDVNSGRATRERNIESTATKTNMEAADEVCRQIRLRDLAGLIVIDFIDMEDKKNVRNVERRMADNLKIDRARVQMGRISNFGLLEISRQRRRTGVLDLSSETCPHCQGMGRVRSPASAGLQLLRAIEAKAAEATGMHINITTTPDVAGYLLNEKRHELGHIETELRVMIRVSAGSDVRPGEFTIEAKRSTLLDTEIAPPRTAPTAARMTVDAEDEVEDIEIEEEEVEDGEEQSPEAAPSRERSEAGPRRRRRRRGGRNGNGAESPTSSRAALEVIDADEGSEDGADLAEPADGNSSETPKQETAEGENAKRRRRRGRRGGRRRRSETDSETSAQNGDANSNEENKEPVEVSETAVSPEDAVTLEADGDIESLHEASHDAPVTEEKPKRRRTRKPAASKTNATVEGDADLIESVSSAPTDEAVPEKPKRVRAKKPAPPTPADAAADVDAVKPKRTRRAKKVEPEAEAEQTPAELMEPTEQQVEPSRAEETLPTQPVFTPPPAPVIEASPAPEAPSKKGWWSKALGR
jgi:ribonuclease E